MRNPLETFSFGNQALTKIYNSNRWEGRVRQEKGSHRASSGQGGREGHRRVIHTLLVQVFSSFLSAYSTDATPLGNPSTPASKRRSEGMRLLMGQPLWPAEPLSHSGLFSRGRRRSKTDFIDFYMPGKSLASIHCAPSFFPQLCFRAFLRFSGEHRWRKFSCWPWP